MVGEDIYEVQIIKIINQSAFFKNIILGQNNFNGYTLHFKFIRLRLKKRLH